MAENLFNPKETARSIEEAGDILLHRGGVPFADLVGDLERLDPKQVKELNDQLRRDNFKPNGLPNVEMFVGVDGHITGFAFKPALSDLRPATTPMVMVATSHKDSGVPEPHFEPAQHKHKLPDFQH